MPHPQLSFDKPSPWTKALRFWPLSISFASDDARGDDVRALLCGREEDDGRERRGGVGEAVEGDDGVGGKVAAGVDGVGSGWTGRVTDLRRAAPVYTA